MKKSANNIFHASEDAVYLSYFGLKSSGKDQSGAIEWKPLLVSQPMRHLRQAFRRLLTIDSRFFDKELSEKSGVPLYLEACLLTDNKGRVMMKKTKTRTTDKARMEPGVYLQINKQVMPGKILAIIMKTPLPPVAASGPTWDYYLLASSASLHARHRREMKPTADKEHYLKTKNQRRK